MELKTATIFFLTIFPLICTPCPDILFTASQGGTRGPLVAVRTVSVFSWLYGYMAVGLFAVAQAISDNSRRKLEAVAGTMLTWGTIEMTSQVQWEVIRNHGE